MFKGTVSSVVTDAGFKGILYGPSGSGKTFSISTVPDQKGVAIISAEAGLRTLHKLCPRIAVEVISSMADLREAYEFLASKDSSEFHTIFIDSVTEIGEIILSDEKKKAKDPRQAYGELAEQAMKAIKAFRDLPHKNVIWIAQEEYQQDDTGRMFYGPSMPGKKLGPKLPYWQDAVFCLRIKKEDDGTYKRAFQCRAVNEEYVAKFRGDELNDFELPDWSHIFAKINGASPLTPSSSLKPTTKKEK